MVDVYRGNSSVSVGQKIDIWTDNDREAQEVYIDIQSDGSCIFRMVCNKNLAIGISGKGNGDQLKLVNYNKDDKGQRWYVCNTKRRKRLMQKQHLNQEILPHILTNHNLLLRKTSF